MSIMVDHYLKFPNLKQMLMDSGVISSRVLHGTHGREVECLTVLDMSQCCPEEFEKDKAAAIEYGVIDFAKKNDNGSYGVRRDLTEEEISELQYWPIQFISNDEVSWFAKWSGNDDPAFFVSKLFSGVELEYIRFYDDETDGIYTIKDGAFNPTPEWKKILRKQKRRRKMNEFLSSIRASWNRILQLVGLAPSPIAEWEDLPF